MTENIVVHIQLHMKYIYYDFLLIVRYVAVELGIKFLQSTSQWNCSDTDIRTRYENPKIIR